MIVNSFLYSLCSYMYIAFFLYQYIVCINAQHFPTKLFQLQIISITTTGTGNFNVYCDIGGQTIAGGTIPPHILVTNNARI